VMTTLLGDVFGSANTTVPHAKAIVRITEIVFRFIELSDEILR
jgi:hypothetical protein